MDCVLQLRDANGLNNLEYSGAADNEQEEGQQPWTDRVSIFFAFLEKNHKKKNRK